MTITRRKPEKLKISILCRTICAKIIAERHIEVEEEVT